jgi:3',5'-cyclic AMP phosphodiesterase CpdA
MRTLIHLSDIHFGRADETVVDRLTHVVNSLEPNLIAVSGDLTQRARRDEFERARSFLGVLKHPQLVVPGNHDVPLWNVPARFLFPLRGYTSYITTDLAPIYQDEEMIVVGVNTARSWTWGEGRINERQVDEIVQRLAAAGPAVTRIVVTHHPFDLPPGVHEKRLLGRAAMAMAKLADANADLFLAGHLHISHIGHSAERYHIEGHSALVVQAGTVSTRSRGEAAAFNVLRIERPLITIERFIWDETERTFTSTAADMYRHSHEGWKKSA